MTMADLLAKQNKKVVTITRGQEIEGEVISSNNNVLILDLGGKSEGILYKKDLSAEQIDKLKIGDKLTSFVIHPENDSGQVVLALNRLSSQGSNNARFARFEQAQKNNEILTGRATELNKGGLIVEVGGMRGFLPSSQVVLSQAANLDDLVGKELKVSVIELDPGQNRLIFTQVVKVSDETKQLLSGVKMGDSVKGQVFLVLPFGLAVKLESGLEGFVHISELGWERQEDPNALHKIGDEIEAKVLSIDQAAGRINLSIKSLQQDPFAENVKKLHVDDIVKGTVSKVGENAVIVTLPDNIEGSISSAKLEGETNYNVGDSLTCMVDSIDLQRRRVNLVPFITSTKDLIYK